MQEEEEEMERKCKTATCSPDKENQKPTWFKHKKAFNKILFTMRLQKPLTPKHSPSNSRRQSCIPLSTPLNPKPTSKIQDFPFISPVYDKTSLLSDEILLRILSKLPKSQRNANFLVCKRWLNLQGRLVRSLRVLDWEFLVSGRLFLRFPNLVHVDLVNGCLVSPRNCGIVCSHKIGSCCVDCDVLEGNSLFLDGSLVLDGKEVDRGLSLLAGGYPNLRKLVVVNASEMGLLSVSEECPTLQELDLLICNDNVLRGIAACQNLQILRLSGCVEGLFDSLVSDVGLTILAQGCKRLVKLELSGCGGSYEGIRAIGQCCQMLEELTLCDHKMEDGWSLALSYCENLKSLRLLSCKKIDSSDGLDEGLGSCAVLESLYFEKCQLRDKRILMALFDLCGNVREVVISNCWGLDDDMFSTATALRRVRFLSLERCSLLTTQGLEFVLTHWNELQSLKVRSCNNVKDCEVNPALSSVFSALKDLKWKPDTKSLLSANLAGTGMGKRGGKFFKKSCDWKSLPGA